MEHLTELLEPPRVTPEDVEQVTFGKARIGGLSEAEVQAFLDRVHDEIAVLLAERDSLQAQVSQLQDAPAYADEPGPAEVQAVRVLARAQATAEQVEAGARKRADELVAAAQRQRDALLADAEEKAGAVLTAAETEAATVRAQAPAEAQVRLARWESLGTSLTGQLRALQEAVAGTLDFWEARPEGEARPARARVSRRRATAVGTAEPDSPASPA